MKAKWMELTMGQRILLCLQGFLCLLFLILYCTVGSQMVVMYQDSPLRVQTDGAVTTYSGKVDGELASFKVSPGPEVVYQWGGRVFGPYAIVFDSTAAPSYFPDRSECIMKQSPSCPLSDFRVSMSLLRKRT